MSQSPDQFADQPSRKSKVRRSADERLLMRRIRAHEKGVTAAPEEIHVGHLTLPAQPDFKTVVSTVLWGLRMLIRGATILYLLALLLLTLGLHWWGQTNVTTAALMYLPAWPWVAPAGVLLLPALFLDLKSGLCLSLATVLFCVFHFDLYWRSDPTPEFNGSFERLKVLTWNRGQGRRVSLKPIKDELRPDFIALQETKASGYPKDPEYAEFTQISGFGEFVLLSRWPILEATPVHAPGSGEMIAARYLVAFGGRRCVIYNLHLPSPRDTLGSYKRGAFLWGVLGFPGSPWESKKMHYQAFWNQQIAMAREIAEKIRQEEHPVIALGDFNSPAFGPIYRIFAAQFQDAHLKGGQGMGFTFPGDTSNPLALFRPWLRLDMIFAPPQWRLWHCETIETQSQHRPVFAEFEWRSPAP